MTSAIQRIYVLNVDFEFDCDGLRFVWNVDKAEANLRKHGIAFEQASNVFFDPFAVYEDASIESERREAVLGKSRNSTLLFVVHLMREDDAIRIISARKATRKEGIQYEDHDGTN